MQREYDDSVELLIAMKHGSDHHALFKEFDIEILEEKGDGRFRIKLPLQAGMGSSDIEDLSEAEDVLALMWDDGSPCHPRG